MNAAIGRVSVPEAAAAAAAMATAAVMAGGDGNDDSCRDGGGEGDGGMLALSVLPLLLTNKTKYQLLSQSHPRLVKMRFLANRHVTAKGSYPTN
jgi:hypothetical protein